MTASAPGCGPFFSRVYDLVATIQSGSVATYGEVAHMIGVPRAARAVGWALRALDPAVQRRVPWHRVVGRGGRISPRPGPGAQIQRRLLRSEGVRFVRGCVDLSRHGLTRAETGLTE